MRVVIRSDVSHNLVSCLCFTLKLVSGVYIFSLPEKWFAVCSLMAVILSLILNTSVQDFQT